MSLTERHGKPYIWATWITGLLSGDKQCEWAVWLKAHYQFEKLTDLARENALAKYKADHAAALPEHAERLRAEGWTVKLEGQNKFNYKGQAATLGGCPDIVALKPGVLRVDDRKTGRARDSDYWQVCTYGFMLPLVSRDYAELVVEGNVIYNDRVRHISPAEIVAAKPLIVQRIKTTAGAVVPPRTPSAQECGFCDIPDCPDRLAGAEMEAEGDVF